MASSNKYTRLRPCDKGCCTSDGLKNVTLDDGTRIVTSPLNDIKRPVCGAIDMYKSVLMASDIMSYLIQTATEKILDSIHGYGFLGVQQDKLESLRTHMNDLNKCIAPVKNVISLSMSSEFVKGNNNKFKLIKRIIYRRSKLINLTKNIN